MTIEMSLGEYQGAVDERLARWAAEGAVERLWAADHTLWTGTPEPEIENRLGWLDLPITMREPLGEIAGFAADVQASGVTDVVLLGMGGSSLAPEVYQRTFGNPHGYPRLRVLDSTHPGGVAAVESAVDLATTLFVVASKSGTTIEPLSFFEYFWAKVEAVDDAPGGRFVAITDPGSHLESVAAERGFLRTFLAEPEVGGRYSALTHFGIVPAALIGADIGSLLREAADARAEAMAGRGGMQLGAALGELALAGRDKVTFLTSPTFASFPAWVEQLIAESTGKDGTGIIPIADEEMAPPGAYGGDRVFVSLTFDGDDTRDLESGLDALAAAGHPVIRFSAFEPEGLATEMYRAELATAMASSVLGIHPFNQPDVQAAKTLARQAMAGELEGDAIEEVPADSEGLTEALNELLAGARPGDYLAIQAFLAPVPANEGALQDIRHAARDRLGIATTVGFGPRFLHSTGQLHKGGPDTGIFIQVIDHATPHLEVPGAGYSFGDLVAGQADGDYRALASAGRRVIRICCGDDVAGGLARLAEAISG